MKEATRVVSRLRSHRLEVKEEGTKQPRSVLPPAGGVRVEWAEGGLTVKPEKAMRGDSRRPARVVLPEVAQQPFQVKDLHSGMMLEVALEGARAAKAEVVDGYVVYPDAHAEGADVVHRFTPEGTEDYLSFERAPSVPEVRYGLKLGTGAAGLRLVDDTLEVLDGSGAPRLRMAPPYLVGADGRVTQAHVSVEGCAVDTRTSAPWERPLTAPGSRQCRVRVGWDAGAVVYPAVLDPVWSTTGSLAEARRGFTTTVLLDGRVLATGGFSPMVGTLSSAELYDPATGTWAATGSLPMAEVDHSAHRLGSGQVLLVGGESTGTTALYDPAAGTWSSAASMATARRYHRTVLLDDGRVLAIGGLDTSYVQLTSAELYDPATNTWAPTGSLSVPREGHGAVLLADGKVLVFGGSDMGAESTSELYEPTTGTWSPGGALSYGRSRPLAERLADDRILMFGGWRQEAEVYDPATNTWSLTSPTLQRRQHATSTLLPDGRVLAVGGMSGTSGSEDSATTELYDPTTGTWSLGPAMGNWRGLHSASVLQDGRVLIAGGMGSAAYVTLATAELLLLDVDDVTAPVATVTSPFEGASVEGEILLTADASDDYSVRRVEFFAGDTLLGTDTAAPFSFSWYTSPWSVPNGSYVLTVRAYDASGNVGTSAPVSILVNNDETPPTVTVTSPAADSVLQGQGLVTLSADALDDRGVVERVEFWDGRRQLGVDTEAPYSMSWDLGSVPGGPHTLIAKAYDLAGNEGTGSIPFTVSRPGTAAYDSTFQVPRCATAGAMCDSGSFLNGRGTLEPELNQPNTLQGSCADGTAGEHYGQSLDRIRISSMNGSPLQMGGTVKIEVSVFATPSYYSEALDLYHAVDATNPVWTYVTTLYPGGSNAQTLAHVIFTLPVGTPVRDQALRGRYRYGGGAAPCGSGAFDDHDDLVFAVGADVTAPSVSFSSPGAGATVKGTLSLQASASDGGGVRQVEFYDGASLLGTDTTAPYSLSWNTTGVANGGHTLTARAYDIAGNVNSATLSVTVNNTVADTTAPTVSLTAPTAGALLTRGVTYTLTATASDNAGVTRVEFFLDGALLGSDTTSPYSLNWSNNTTVGSHSLFARAYDAAGNVASSTTVTVSVQNPPPPSGNTLTYSASNTSSATVNTSNQTIALMAGQVLTLGTCGVTGSSFTGDTYLRLNNPSGTTVVFNDDACGGMGSSFTYTVPAGAGGNYQLRAGCYSSGSCGGTVAWTLR
ncbi:Ig-like domain-containing protein [Archangium sp.]|uniref:Ig-like domain-containing protein n=1 Tax=Archangium sp. TaxID=1872627 RepID=UPI00286B0D56|nr:Ig-like domain-containing protein [Archangium sp.]